MSDSGSRRALGVLPEERVGAEADHRAALRQGGGLVEHADQRIGIVREPAEEQPVDARRRAR